MYNVKTKEYDKGIKIDIFEKNIGIPKDTRKQYVIKKINGKLYKLDTDTGKLEKYDRTNHQVNHSINTSKNRTVSKIYDYGMSNDWTHFGTLTLSPEKIDRYDYKLCMKTVRKWFNNIKYNYYKDLKYLVVPEQHKDRAWHFHCLVGGKDIMQVKKALGLRYSGKNRKGMPVDNATRFKLGYTDFELVRDTQKASNYITKYITKDLVTNIKNAQRYFISQNCNLPKEKTYNLDKEHLEMLKKYLEKKTQSEKDTYHKSIPIESPNYKNQLDIYNFPQKFDINKIDYKDIVKSVV